MAYNFKTSLKNQIVLILLGLIGTSSVLYLISHFGAGINPDSAYYISIARNINSNSWFIGYDGIPVVLQPPLYPLVLSAITLVFQADPLLSAGYVNAILFGLIIYFSGLFLLKHLTSEVLFFLGTVAILVSYTLLETSLMALSESLFILLGLLFIHALENYYEKQNKSSLFKLALIAILASLTRYMGIVFISVGMISILYWNNNTKEERFKHTLLYLFGTSLPIGLWIIRNYFISGTFFGQRGESSYTLSQNLGFYIETLIPWFIPDNIKGYLFVSLFIILIIMVSIESKLLNRINKDSTALIGPIFIFILLYSFILIISSTLKAYDTISTRLLSPVYIPLVFILFISIDKIIKWSGKYINNLILTFIAAYCIITIFRYPFEDTRSIIKEYYKFGGFQYGSQYWKESETIKYLKQHNLLQEKYIFYSNAPELVNLFTNIETRWSPGKTMYNSPKPLDKNSIFRKVWKRGDEFCLVWFNDINRNFLLSIEELKEETTMKEIAHFSDGNIFEVTKK